MCIRDRPESVTIKSLNGSQEEIDLTVPYDAQRIAVLDMAALDILDNLGPVSYTHLDVYKRQVQQ